MCFNTLRFVSDGNKILIQRQQRDLFEAPQKIALM